MKNQFSQLHRPGKRQRVSHSPLSRCGRNFPITVLLLLLGLSSGCAMLPQPEILAPTESNSLPLEPATGNQLDYQIDQLDITLHTYRAGWLSHLAHNHVLQTSSAAGVIRLAQPINQSSATFYFRPWDLVLDDPSARRVAGPGFESLRSEADIAATRTRMLGPRGFHSNEYPFVVVDVEWVSDERAALDIHFRGRTLAREVPISWQQDPQLRVQADFELTHRELGLQPYSAFLGAMAVAEPIRVQLRLTAHPAE